MKKNLFFLLNTFIQSISLTIAITGFWEHDNPFFMIMILPIVFITSIIIALLIFCFINKNLHIKIFIHVFIYLLLYQIISHLITANLCNSGNVLCSQVTSFAIDSEPYNYYILKYGNIFYFLPVIYAILYQLFFLRIKNDKWI
jgi:hypothetical protein